MVHPDQSNSGCGCCGTSAAGEPRRGFLAKSLALLIGAAAYATPAVVGIVAFLSPLRREKGQAEDFLRLSSLELLPEDGTPVKTPVIRDRVDAWNYFPNEPVGAVLLRRIGKDEVQAFQVECPHAGCFIGYDEAAKQFVCPCHKATFTLDGKRGDAVSESPRDLDALEVKIEGSNVPGEVSRSSSPERPRSGPWPEVDLPPR